MKRSRTSSSDRATAYAEAVCAGEIVAGLHVRNACQRHLHDLEHGAARNLRYNPEQAGHAIRYFEQVLKLSDGQFDGRKFELHGSQAFIVGSLFGWQRNSVDHGWIRRFRRAYIEQAKGNGKSPLCAGIGLYCLTSDDEPGAEIYSCGATKDQASVLFRDAVAMVRQSASLSERIEIAGAQGRETNLAYLRKSSFFRPISREKRKSGSGPRPHLALADELHEHPDRAVVEMLERGFKFRRQPLLIMVTNSGNDRRSYCWEEHEHGVKCAAGNFNARDDDAMFLGEPVDDTTFSFICALDKGDDPLNDPSCWVKANPLLGVTITEEYLQGVVDQAKAMPGKLNSIMRLHFCRWTDSETAWMSEEALRPCVVDFEPLDIHQGERVFMGVDLSQTKDLTALAYCCESGKVEQGEHAGKPIYDLWVQCWTPRDTMAAREMSDKLPYALWVSQGYLEAPKGQTIPYRHVAQAIAEAQHDYEIGCLAFDRYAFSRMLEPEMQELGLQIECVEHPQGGVKKGRATEAMKQAALAAGREPEGLWMPQSVRQFETLVLERRIRIRRNPLLISAIMSSMLEADRWDNQWLSKQRSTSRIDAAVASCMAVGAALAHEVSSEKEYTLWVL